MLIYPAERLCYGQPDTTEGTYSTQSVSISLVVFSTQLVIKYDCPCNYIKTSNTMDYKE